MNRLSFPQQVRVISLLTKDNSIRIERCNPNMRTQLRRHTRHTNGHGKKLAHHRAAVLAAFEA